MSNIYIYLLLLLAPGNLGNPAWQVKAHRGFFLLLPTTCQKRGLAEQPSILMWLENIQERKGKSFPDIFLNVHSGTMLCAHMTEPQEAPVHLDFSPLFSTHCWVPVIFWNTEHSQQWGAGHPILQSPATGSQEGQPSAHQDGMAPVWMHQTVCSLAREQMPNSWHSRDKCKHLTFVSKKLLLEFLYQTATWLRINMHTFSCIPDKINIYQQFPTLQLNIKEKRLFFFPGKVTQRPEEHAFGVANNKGKPHCAARLGQSLSTN